MRKRTVPKWQGWACSHMGADIAGGLGANTASPDPFACTTFSSRLWGSHAPCHQQQRFPGALVGWMPLFWGIDALLGMVCLPFRLPFHPPRVWEPKGDPHRVRTAPNIQNRDVLAQSLDFQPNSWLSFPHSGAGFPFGPPMPGRIWPRSSPELFAEPGRSQAEGVRLLIAAFPGPDPACGHVRACRGRASCSGR